MVTMRRTVLVPSLLLVLVGCGDDSPADPDGGLDGAMPRDVGPADDSGVTDADVPTDAGIDFGVSNPLVPRVDNTTCRFDIESSPGAYTFPNAYPSLASFDRPIWVGTAPGEPDTVYVAEQGGTIFAFDDDPSVSSRTTFHDQTVLRAGNEEGLLGLAFHPDYATNGRFFIHYSSNSGCPPTYSRCGVISELARASERMSDPGSERRMIVVGQPYGNHNGGAIAFGPDGRLYISLGDGGSAGDPENSGQQPTTLLGSVLRIDVDVVPAGDDYGIPSDNPFADGVGGAPEVWAWGLRNTWRMSFDRATGELWGGDVGQNAYEEINRLRSGNFGWNVREGFHCYNAATCADGFIDPETEYPRSQGQSVTGGVVYRGSALSELWGQYLFGDFVSGRIWAHDPSSGSDTVLGNSSNVASFGELADGEVRIATFDGRIRAIQRTGMAPAPLPATLSATGCFDDVGELSPAAGVVPYEVNTILHSDGADKRRWFALPAGESGTIAGADGRVTVPVGSVFIKHFEIDVDGSATPRRLETRFLVRTVDGFRGFTYRWNAEGTDADLLEDTTTDTFPSGGSDLTWTYPSRAQCSNCHTTAAGELLGFRSQQLDGVGVYDGIAFPQLPALTEAGYLTGSAALPAYPAIDDAGASVEARARAYLATNCAMCHQPGGPGNASIDLRFGTAFGGTATCDEVPTQGDLGLTDARIIAPGAPERSVLLERMSRRGVDQMPPLATERTDDAAIAVISDWIESLSSCP